MKQYTYFVQDPASKAYAPILTAYSDGEPTAQMIEDWFTQIKIQQGLGIPRPTFYTVADMLEVPAREEKAVEVPKNGHGSA